MFESWKVGIVLSAVSNVSSVMGSATKATLIANNALNKQGALLKKRAAQEAALREQLQKTQAVARVATAGFMSLAAVSGAAIFEGVKGAADLQQAMMSVAVATGRATNNMGDFYRMAFRVSGMTAQSVTTIAQEMAMAAAAGLSDPRQLMTAFPRIAKAADVMWMSPKHLDPVESVKQMSTLSHLFGAYSGAPLQHMLDRATQMMFIQPESIQAMVAQGRMFIPAALSRGVSEEDIWKSAMTMGQTGFLRSRGGSGLARVIEYLGGASALTGHLSKRQDAAMRTLGLVDAKGRLQFEDGKGHLLLGKAVDHLEKMSHRFNPVDFGNLLTNAFLAQGGRYMAAVLRPSVYEKTQQNWRQMNKIGGVDTLWKKYTDMFWYQWNVFATNFSNVTKTIFLPLLPTFTKYLRDAGNALGRAVMYLSSHPKQAKLIGEGILATFVASIIGVGTVSVAASINVWRINRALTALALNPALVGGGGPTGGAGGAGFWKTVGSAVLSPFAWIVKMIQIPALALIALGNRMLPALQWANKLPGMGTKIVGFILKLTHIALNPLDAIGAIITRFYSVLRTIALSTQLAGLSGIGDEILGFVGKLAGLAKFIPGIDVLAMVLGTQSPAGESDDSSYMMDISRYMKTHGGHAPPPQVHVHQPVFNFPKGTPKEHANQFLNHVLNGPLGGSRAGVAVHPRMSRLQFGRAF